MTAHSASSLSTLSACAALADYQGLHVRYDTPDSSFSPHFSNIGLTFSQVGGIDGVHLHYNRRTVALGGPALASDVRGIEPDASLTRVTAGPMTCAFFDKDSFVIEASAPLHLGLLDAGALRIISDRTDEQGLRHIHTMVTTLDPRDPDPEVPLLISMRMLRGNMAERRAEPGPDGSLYMALHFELLTPAVSRAQEALERCPTSLAQAEAGTRAWMEYALGDLQLHPANPREHEVLCRALQTLLFNTVAAPGRMEGRLASYPSRGGYPTHFLWDTLFHLLALEDMNDVLARDALLLLSDNMRADGLMHHFICSTWVRPQGSQPPLFGWAAERFVRRTGDLALARDLLPKLEANTNWWLMQRMTSLGLISCFDPFETGWDDTPRLDHGPIIACDMNAYLLMQMRSTARIAELCGQIHRADAINLQADGFARTMLEVLYDEGKNRFHDVLIATGEKLAIVSPAIYLPLLGDIGLPHEKAVAMIRDGLLDPAQLYGAIPFPCVAYNDPSYDPQQMWRGPMWPQISWLLLELLERFGLHDEREASAQALYRIILDEGNLHEYFNSQTGEGLGFPQQGWTAAIFLRLHGDRMRNRAGRIAGADAP